MKWYKSIKVSTSKVCNALSGVPFILPVTCKLVYNNKSNTISAHKYVHCSTQPVVEMQYSLAYVYAVSVGEWLAIRLCPNPH